MSVDVEIPLQLITPDLVRSSIKRARRNLESAAEEIIWQIEREAWRTLGYPSWTAMREAEYGGAAFMVPSKNRPELVARIREAGVSQREIARTVGVDEGTVRNDLRGASAEYSALQSNAGPDPEVFDAEIIEDPQEVQAPAPAEPTTATCPTCHGTGKVTP